MLRREYYTCRPGDARLPTPCWEKKREGTIAVYNINSKQLTRTSEEGKQQQQQSKKKRKRTKEKFLARPALYISFHCCAAYIRILSRPPTSCLESAMSSCVFFLLFLRLRLLGNPKTLRHLLCCFNCLPTPPNSDILFILFIFFTKKYTKKNLREKFQIFVWLICRTMTPSRESVSNSFFDLSFTEKRFI